MHLSVQKEVADLLRDKDVEFALCDSPSLRKDRLICIEKNGKKAELEALAKTPALYPKHPYPAQENANTHITYGKLQTSLIINQAGGILENAGCSLHRNFGYPIIPGSALKGIASHAAWRLWQNAEDEKTKMSLATSIISIFGYPTGHTSPSANLDAYIEAHAEELGLERSDGSKKAKAFAGGVGFMTAEPYYEYNSPDTCMLHLDVTTSHHMKYYAESVKNAAALAADSERPNPQFFISVKPGAEFRFILRRLRKNLPDETFKFASDLLVSALEVLGVGAKTGSGYGNFEDCTAAKQKKQREEDERKEYEANVEKALTELSKLESEPEERRREHLLVFEKTYTDILEKNQRIRDEFRRLMPEKELTPVDIVRNRWEKLPNLKAILNGPDIKNFDKHTDEEKTAIVSLLRESEGRGHDVWLEFKNPKKDKKLNPIETAIRTFNKAKGWGKMP